MARVTVEDCIEKVENRFELVMLAAQRARKIGAGARLTVERDNDKNPVVALREIAQESISAGDLRKELIRNHQRIISPLEEEESIDLMDGEEEWNAIVSNRVVPSLGVDVDDEDFDESGASGADSEESEPSLEDLAGGDLADGLSGEELD